jgi:hypothetical protein
MVKAGVFETGAWKEQADGEMEQSLDQSFQLVPLSLEMEMLAVMKQTRQCPHSHKVTNSKFPKALYSDDTALKAQRGQPRGQEGF